MKFNPCRCPECGQDPMGLVESLEGIALFQELFEGDEPNCEYSGETEVDWDSQRSVRDGAGMVRLVCHLRHEWKAQQEKE
jgi:hypothetical protein